MSGLKKITDGQWIEVFDEAVKIATEVLTPKAPKVKPNVQPTAKQRQYISIENERNLHKRACGQCEWIFADGTRCDSRHQLEKEHHIPIAHGGTDSYDNLKLYCRAHNQYAAQKAGLKRKSSCYSLSH